MRTIIHVAVILLMLAGACRRSPVVGGEEGRPSEGTEGQHSGDATSTHTVRSPKSSSSSVTQGDILRIHGRELRIHALVAGSWKIALPPDEQMILKRLREVSYRWELDSFHSALRRRVMLFIFFIIDASRKERIPARYAEIMEYLRHTFMELYLYKGAEPPEPPHFPYTELENLVNYLYNRGFNLGVTSDKALKHLLDTAHKTLWKGAQGSPVSVAEFREYLDSEVLSVLKGEARQSLKTVFSLMTGHGGDTSADSRPFMLTPSVALWLPWWNSKNAVVWTLVRDRKTLGDMDEIMRTISKRGYAGWKTVHRYVLVDAAGPCSMCIPRKVAPSHPALPWNIIASDWQYYTVGLIQGLMRPDVSSTLATCGLDVLRHMVQSGIGNSDIDIREQVRRLLLLQWYALQSPSGQCRLAPTLMAAYLAVMEHITGSGEPGVFSHYMDLVVSANPLAESQSQERAERRDRPTYPFFTKSSPIDFSLQVQSYPYLYDKGKFTERLKWLLSVASRWPLRRELHIVSLEFRNAAVKTLSRAVPRTRVYVHPRMTLSGGAVVLSEFRNLWEALNWRVHRVVTSYVTRWK